MEEIKDPVTEEEKASERILPEDASEEKNDIPEERSLNDGSNDTLGIKDYEEIMRRDIEELHVLFPHLADKKSVTELDNPLRYAALRDLGLTPKEAYLASSNISTGYDNRSHITSSAPKGASASSDMLSAGELEAARMIFSELSDRDIQKLYKKVTK